MLALAEGGVLSVIVRNAFDGVVPDSRLNYTVAYLTAAPEFANLTSFLWAAFSHGRAKVRFMSVLQVATIVLVATIALAPRTPNGLVLLALAYTLARVFITGLVTLRATVWRANYPRRDRVWITGRLQTVTVIVSSMTGFVLGAAMDWSPEAFRVLIPVMCILGVGGAVLFAQVRVRGHARLVRSERDGHHAHKPSLNPLTLLKVLFEDRRYGVFQVNMFLLGAGNLMLAAPLAITLKEHFDARYTTGIAVITAIPQLVMPLAIPFWSRLLQRVHVVRFRSFHSWVFVVGQLVVSIALSSHALPLLYVSAALMGVGYAGGSLAWNLGHLDFAPAARASQYMAVHLMLNGVRGILAPFAAVLAYELLEGHSPGWGQAVFGLSVALCIIGAVGFGLMSRSMGAAGRAPPREH